MPGDSRTNASSSENKDDDANAILEAMGTCHIEKVNELSSTPPHKQELEGSRLPNDSASSDGWRPSSTLRIKWPPPIRESNGYLLVSCNSRLNQQKSASKQQRLQISMLFLMHRS